MISTILFKIRINIVNYIFVIALGQISERNKITWHEFRQLAYIILRMVLFFERLNCAVRPGQVIAIFVCQNNDMIFCYLAVSRFMCVCVSFFSFN